MNDFLDALYGVLFQPRQALRHIAADRPVGQAVAAFAIGVLLPAAAVLLGMQAAGLPFAVPLLFAQVAVSLIMWFITAGVLHLTAEMAGGHGAALSLFCGLGFAQFPRIFIVPAYVLAALLPPSARPLTVVLAALAIAVWLLVLNVLALQAAYDFGTARAVLVLLAPALVTVLLMAVLALMVAAAAAGFIRQGVVVPPGMW